MGKAFAGLQQIVAFGDDFLAGGRGDNDRRNRMRHGMRPGFADLFDRLAHADGVDFRRGAERADRDRNVVAPPGAVDHVGEQKGAALFLG